jgi:hypothetical protein
MIHPDRAKEAMAAWSFLHVRLTTRRRKEPDMIEQHKDHPSAGGWLDDVEVWLPPEIDTTVPHPARRYDYWLGGKDNFAADRESGDAVEAVFPTIRLAALENRRFLGRAVGFLTQEAGVDQFLDIGTGIPASGNTHEVAQRFNPKARVVYVDNDPIVLTHARALLTNTTSEGETAYIDADLRDPDSILADPALASTLDLSRPVALMLIAVLHFLGEDDDPYGTVSRLVGALSPGSYLIISHSTFDYMTPEQTAASRAIDARFRPRSLDEVARFFDGLDLVPPGLVPTSEWRARHELQPRPPVADVATYGGVARTGGTIR